MRTYEEDGRPPVDCDELLDYINDHIRSPNYDHFKVFNAEFLGTGRDKTSVEIDIEFIEWMISRWGESDDLISTLTKLREINERGRKGQRIAR